MLNLRLLYSCFNKGLNMPVYKYKTEEYLNSEAWKKQTSIGTSWSLSMPKKYRRSRCESKTHENSQGIDLLAEAGVKGNIRASDVFASFNSISPKDL